MFKIFLTIIFFSLAFTQIFNSYSEQEGILGWQISQMTYCSPASIQALDCGACGWACHLKDKGVTNMKVISNETKKIQGFSFAMNGHIYISFRGSSNINNWLQNADFVHKAYPKCTDCKVHKGFYNDFLSFAESGLIKDLQKIKNELGINKIILYGHSLGGAIAYIAAGEVLPEFSVARIITYGSPRVGNLKYSTWWDSQISESFRITHAQDPVPHVPPHNLGYNHMNSEVWYFEHNTLNHKMCSATEDKTCSNSIHLFNVQDHLTYMSTGSKNNENYNDLENIYFENNDYVYDEQTEEEIEEPKKSFLAKQ